MNAERSKSFARVKEGIMKDWPYAKSAVLVPLDTLTKKYTCEAFSCENIASELLMTQEGEKECYCYQHADMALNEATNA